MIQLLKIFMPFSGDKIQDQISQVWNIQQIFHNEQY